MCLFIIIPATGGIVHRWLLGLRDGIGRLHRLGLGFIGHRINARFILVVRYHDSPDGGISAPALLEVPNFAFFQHDQALVLTPRRAWNNAAPSP